MDNTKEPPVILSICTGIRGLERGIERVIGSVRISAYVEIEAFICWNLVAAMESGILDPAPIWTDVKTFPSQHFRGKVHGIIGGYPCQPFSNAGNRKGEEDARHLWPFIEHQINTIRPLWCFFENVAGHLTLGFESVKHSMEEMGYRVEAGIYSAEEAGAPHRRERLFILAVLANSDINRIRRWVSCSDTRKESTNETASSGGELAYTQCDRGNKSCSWDKPEQFDEDDCEGGNLPHTFSQGLEERREQPAWEEQPSAERSGRIIFPSRRGEQQYDWEAPRTTQSGLGCTAHGYNFREDLLRALGNGVVEQTAELAFRDLLRKHFENGTEPNI